MWRKTVPVLLTVAGLLANTALSGSHMIYKNTIKVKSLRSTYIEKLEQRNWREKLHYYDAKIASLEAEIKLLKTNNTSENVPKDNNKLKQKVDNIQEQSKNKNIRLMGVKEIPHEDATKKGE
nr:unnamed protein product [Callosobruchus chinensis]